MKRKRFNPDDKDNRCKCGAPGQFDHTCPYKVELFDDKTTLCNCCSSCRSGCAEDV